MSPNGGLADDESGVVVMADLDYVVALVLVDVKSVAIVI